MTLFYDFLPDDRLGSFASLAVHDLYPPFPTLHILFESDLILAEIVEHARELRPAQVEMIYDVIVCTFQQTEVLDGEEVQKMREQVAVVSPFFVSLEIRVIFHKLATLIHKFFT